MMRKITDEKARWAYDKWCIGYTQIQIADALHVSDKTLGAGMSESALC